MAQPPFELINRYAHKRKGINIGNPALIWHKAYWKPKGEDNDTEWHQSIDEYIEKTIKKLTAFASRAGVKFQQYDDKAPIFPAKAEINANDEYPIQLYGSHISFRISGMKLSVIFEKFDEFWSVKTVLDFSNVAYSPLPLPLPLPLPFPFFESIHSNISEIEDIAILRYNDRNIRFALNETEMLDERERVRKRVGEISHSISQALNDLHNALFPQITSKTGTLRCDLDTNLFANFFGFSLGVSMPKKPGERAKPLPRKRATDVVNNISATSIFDDTNDDQVLGLIDAIWPVATDLNPYISSNRKIKPQNFEFPRTSREFTISRLNRSRALYITSLGAIREIPQKKVYFPLAYLMVSPHRATWQIGRIIDRIHTLGIFRLASFMEYNEIEVANNDMRRLIDRTNKAGDLDIEVLSSDFRGLGKGIGNGLHYRIEWSRFYARLYRESIEMLSFERVEGYQTYKEFVARKLNERFETIDSVGRRFDHLSRLIQTSVGQRTGSTIRELLHFAEKVSVIPISYYLHSVLKHVSELGTFEPLNAFFVSLFGVIVPLPAWEVIWVSFSLAYAGNVLIVKSESRVVRKVKKLFIYLARIASRRQRQLPQLQQPNIH